MTSISVGRVIALLLCAMSVTGCTSWRAATAVELVQIVARDRPYDIRIARSNGEQIRLRDPIMRQDSITDGRASVAVADIERGEVRRFSGRKTLLLIATIPTLAFGLFVISFSGYDHVAG